MRYLAGILEIGAKILTTVTVSSVVNLSPYLITFIIAFLSHTEECFH